KPSTAMSCGSLISAPRISSRSRRQPGSTRVKGRPPSCCSAWSMIAVAWPTKSIIARMGRRRKSRCSFCLTPWHPRRTRASPFGGGPACLYADNGPVTRSHVFYQVMDYLGIEVQTHVPRGHDGRRTTARAKGKVERPFRTVKEAHETLYHFHEPQTEAEANA